MTNEILIHPSQPRFARVRSLQSSALDCHEVSIEALVSRGIAQLTLTGLPDAWLRDSREKLRALVAAHTRWGALDRLLVHLLPAELSKAGAHLELPIAVACICALESLPHTDKLLEKYCFIGAIGLDGSLKHTEVSRALERSSPGQVLGPSQFKCLRDLLAWLRSDGDALPESAAEVERDPLEARFVPVTGRLWEKTLLWAAAASELPVLMMGPPGAGKSLLARWAHGLLPSPKGNVSLQKQQIWQLAGLPMPEGPPCMAPHARAHISEYVGASRFGTARPGIFSLAHGGQLILDEFLEINRDCREILRTVLDQREILQNTKAGSLLWPAQFWLIATTNPCPCGMAMGRIASECRCSDSSRRQYAARLSGPMLDRFGLRLFVRPQENTASDDILLRSVDASLFEASSLRAQERVRSAREQWGELLTRAEERAARAQRFAHHSPREKKNKIRLIAGLFGVLPEASGEDIMSIVARLASSESELFFHRG